MQIKFRNPPTFTVTKHFQRVIIIGLIFCCVLGCEQNDSTPNRSGTNTDAQASGALVASPKVALQSRKAVPQGLLASVDTVGGTFTLHVAACDNDECSLQVHWLSAAHARDHAALEWKVPAADVDQVQKDLWYGTAGISAGTEGQPAFTVGEEYQAVTTNIQAVRLAEDQAALLVRQRAGFEHVKHRFYLFVVEGDRIERAWFAEEGVGPYRSDVAVVPGNDGNEEVIHFQGFAPPFGDEVDTLRVSRLRWMPAQNVLAEESSKGLPSIRIIPGYDSVSAARTARDQAADCIGGYWLLASSQVDTLSQSVINKAVVIAGLAASPTLAQSELVRVRSCLKPGGADLAQLANFIED